MLNISKRLPSKRAFITGAGSGLGKQLAIQLAAEGWSLGLCDLTEDRLADTLSQVEGLGGKAFPFYFDVSDSKAYQQVASDFVRHVGIDLLINNAGVGDGALVDEYPPDQWDWLISINLMGVVYGCHYFIPYMKEQKSGHIINIASAAAFSNMPEMGPYNVAKAGVLSLSETLLLELKPYHVGVSVVMPTFFQTNIHQFAKSDEAREMTLLLMEDSKLSASKVAAIILERAGNKRFRILVPGTAKVLFWLSRWFPGLFMWFKSVMYKRRDALRENLLKKHGKQ